MDEEKADEPMEYTTDLGLEKLLNRGGLLQEKKLCWMEHQIW